MGLKNVVTLTIMDIPFQKSKKGITVKVKVEPRSSQKGIAGLLGDTIKIKVHAAPVGGGANEELIRIISEEFGIRRKSIQIIQGKTSRDKTIEIEGWDTLP
jgi:uncharacterized protein (TIGR00251 family)